MILLLAVLSSCNKEDAPDCFQKAGLVTTEVRVPGEFTRIELRDYIQVELYDSMVFFIEVTAPRNLIPDIITDVNDGLLKIENRNTCNFVRSYSNRIIVRIYAPAFPDIQNYGTGDIKSVNTIQSHYFKIENRKAAGKLTLAVDVDSLAIYTHTGVSDAVISGSSDKTYLFNQGLGFIDARNLVTAEAYVNNSSINDVYVFSSGYLFAFIQFSGNIYFAGSPDQVDEVVEGTGSVSPLP